MASSNPASKQMSKPERAKLAKDTINNVVPHILKFNARAQDGVKSSELIRFSILAKGHTVPSASGPSPRPTDQFASAPSPPRVSVIQSDTLDAVQTIVKAHPKARVAALNMASDLQPGGGVLTGAVAQEEALCMRSTLYAALDNSFYRIPEEAVIYSPDILVFRSANIKDLPKADWFFYDVISCAAIRRPDVMKDDEGKKAYENEEDREVMTKKIRMILQVAKEKGISHLVLGALGCGAFQNPPEDVARIFKKIILGDRRHPAFDGMEEIVFAIFDNGENLRVFRELFSAAGS